MDKQAVIAEVEGGFDKLLATVQGLDGRAMIEVFSGAWSPKDVLAHIAGWQHTMTGALERMARGERPTPEGVDYSDADAWNAKFAAAMAPQSPPTVIADLKQSFANYIRAAKALSEDRFGEGKTASRLLESSGYGHYAEHLPALQEFAAHHKKN
ncbi:MAG: ClbS/DfsB family four-helix bundle protein [Chloroflexota bacterium]|nr:ClbS/DfsB family four-helix bundle protein [Chloroflexota bacterium]